MSAALARFALLAVATACGTRPGVSSASRPEPNPLKPPAPVASKFVAPPVAVAPGTAVGTAHPVVLEQAAPDGRWVVLCQAREDTDRDGRVGVTLGPRGELVGDRMQSYFVEGAGAGEPIDEFVASDPQGRFVTMVRDRRLLLLDTVERKTIDLSARGADTRSDAANYLPHRAVAFDAEGKRLLYPRRDPDRTRAVVLDLGSGQETVIDPGAGALWRADLVGAGAVLQVVASDTNHNGRPDFPVPEANTNPWRCRGPIPRFDAWQSRGDAIEIRFAASGATDAVVVPGFVAAFGSDFVVREPNGRLVLARRGTPNTALVHVTELAPARCGARILYGDEVRGLLLIACTSVPGRAPVELVGVGYRNDLKVAVEPRASDMLPRSPERLFALYPGAQGLVVDFETRRTSALESGETVIAVHGARALVRRGLSLSIRDIVTGAHTSLPGQIAELGDVLHQPPISLASPLVVDLEKGEIGALPAGGRPLALARDGRALLPARSADASTLATGPLTWEAPATLR